MANNLDFTFTGKDKTQQAFQSLNRSVSKTQKGFDKLKGAISFLSTAGGVALVGTFGAMATSLNKTADRIGKVSSKLGVSTEALQKLQFSAEQSGVSTETLNILNGINSFIQRCRKFCNDSWWICICISESRVGNRNCGYLTV